MTLSVNKQHRKAKIICTLGPSSARAEIITSLISNGMDVARLNFSHGDHDSHHRVMTLVRKASVACGRPVAVLQDLQGIKIRVGRVLDGAVELKKGKKLSVVPGDGLGDKEKIFISYTALLKDARKGDMILLDDGMIQLSVLGKTGNTLNTVVVEGGILKEKKGVNLPGVRISANAFTEKDKRDLMFGVRMGIDGVAISFVRSAHDIQEVKKWWRRKKIVLPIIAKIEKPEALSNIGEILDEVDGIMIARGDLGVEMPAEEVPMIQKHLIDKANSRGKTVITATQMLESMTAHLSPTRAEATDVANAVLDGTDALMLSAETATGLYPVEALRMMDRIIRHTESLRPSVSTYTRGHTFAEAAADAACRAAEDTKSKVIAGFTQSGFTARLLSKLRPSVPIIAFTPDEVIRNRGCLYWGVTPKIMRLPKTTDEMISEVERLLVKEKIVKKGDSIVITSSSPLSTQGKTNFMKLHRVGE
jgi:pyruvate kinase